MEGKLAQSGRQFHMYQGHKELSDIYQHLSSIHHIYALWPHGIKHICTLDTRNLRYLSVLVQKTAQCMCYVLKVWPRSYLSVVVFQNKLSNVISGSFIIHLTEQTTSYFVIHHFKKMAFCMISAMGKLGPWWNGKFLEKFLHLILHSLIVIERISK